MEAASAGTWAQGIQGLSWSRLSLTASTSWPRSFG
jgi:hypothetical protein